MVSIPNDTKLVDILKHDNFVNTHFNNFDSAEELVDNLPGKPIYLKDTFNIEKSILDEFISKHSNNIKFIGSWDQLIEKAIEDNTQFNILIGKE